MNCLYYYLLFLFFCKVCFVFVEKKIEVELIEEKYWEQDVEFCWCNLVGKILVLKMGNKLFVDSIVICEYFEDL